MSQSLFNIDVVHSLRTGLFGGAGHVRVWELGPVTLAPFTAVLACELEPGGWVGPHVQEHYSEIVVCLAGAGTVTVNGQETAFVPGSIAQLPLGHTLAIANGSELEPLRYMIIKALP